MTNKLTYKYGQTLGNNGATYLCDSLHTEHKYRMIWVVCGVCKKDWLVEPYSLKTDKAKSCCYGLVPKRKPQETLALKSPVHNVWMGIKARCLNPNSTSYSRYGGRGITVSAAWLSFRNFEKDMRPSYVPGLQLDRIDNDKGYSKENCRWVTRSINCRNKVTNFLISYKGETKTLIEWAEITGISYDTLYSRLSRGDQGDKLFSPAESIYNGWPARLKKQESSGDYK